MQMYFAKFKGLQNNEWGDSGIWVTKEQLDSILERQYDPDLCNKTLAYGGEYVKPKDFEGVTEKNVEISEVMKKSSPCINSGFLESLAEAGHLAEVVKYAPGGYEKFVQGLVDSGKYVLESGESESKELDNEGLRRFEELKSQHKIG